MEDLVVIGGGFAGLACARTAALRGLRVCVLERRQAIGVRTHTTGIVVKEAAEEWEIPPRLSRRIAGVRLYAPGLRAIDLDSPGYYFLATDTPALLRWFARGAQHAGVRIVGGAPFLGARREGEMWQLDGYPLDARFLVGAASTSISGGGKDFDEFSRRAQQEYGTLWLRGRVSKLYQDGDKVMVCGEDSLIGRPVEIAADMVVLATAAEANDGAAELAQTLKVSYDTNHFFIEAHPKLRPVETQTDGIFLAGSCVGPRDIPESVAQGSAAAAKVAGLFSQEFLTSDPMVSSIDQAKCSGCLMCQEVCPFSAIDSQKLRDGRTVSVTNESLCKGCGLCVAACRFGAANLRGFTQQQLLAEVVSLWQ